MKIDDYFIAWGIAKNSSKASRILAEIQGEAGGVPLDVGAHIRAVYKKAITEAANVNGQIFELLLCETLKKLGLTPFAYKANLKKVPNIEWDIVFWDAESSHPIILWLTTSVRERYQLADMQAFRLKHDFETAEVYLVSMDQSEVARFSATKFESLDGLIFPDSPEFGKLITRLGSMHRSPLSDSAISNEIERGRIIY